MYAYGASRVLNPIQISLADDSDSWSSRLSQSNLLVPE